MNNTFALDESKRLIVDAINETVVALRQLFARLSSDPRSQPPEGQRKRILQSMRRNVAKLFHTKEKLSVPDDRVYPVLFIAILDDLFAELVGLLVDNVQPLDAAVPDICLNLALEGINNTK